MCGIVAVFQLKDGEDPEVVRRLAVAASSKQRHRGPDWSGVFVSPQAVMVHERLAIVDIYGGAQPLLSTDRRQALCVNGEIYNHRELKESLTKPYDFQTDSDCEVINALWREHGASFIDQLNGIFAFALWDDQQKRFLIARDPMGVCPLYFGHDRADRLWVASEMKAISDICDDVACFPPGHYWDSAEGEIKTYYQKDWRDYAQVRERSMPAEQLKQSLMDAVKRQLMSDVPYGVLLSGGLDSSLVAWCATQFADKRVEDEGKSKAWWPRLHSFAVGLPGSPDLIAAQKAADALGTEHHEFHFTVAEGFDVLPDVIRHIETYDVTTIRASTPMFLLARRIRSMGIKMVLSGEGSDELFGGYLYFHKAPNAQEFHDETVRKLDKLHLHDCLRANKSMAAWGVEARVPFLDLEFIDAAMRIDAAHKMIAAGGIEKRILREAFSGCLPDEILWRQKEQFSDGVGYGWIDGLKENAARLISDPEFSKAEKRFPINPPQSKEAYFYRRLFEEIFPSAACASTVPGGKSIACSSPAAIAWDASFASMADPSGRAVKAVHQQSY